MENKQDKNRKPGTFKPGQSGNPKGRPPKGYSITEWFREMLASDPQIKDELGSAILQKAKSGDVTAMKLVWNYLDGMPQQKMDVTSDGKPLPTPIYGGKAK